MLNDIILPVEVPTTQTENLSFTLKELLMLRADAASPGVVALVLGALDENGKWRPDVPERVIRKTDDLESDDPALRAAATLFQELIFTATCAENEVNDAKGVSGLSVWDATKALIPSELDQSKLDQSEQSQ